MDAPQILIGKISTVLFIILTLITLSGLNCAPEAVHLINIGIAKDEVINYHNNGEYEKDTRKAIEEAIEKFNGIDPVQNAVVIFDIDETAISSYGFYRKWDFGYVPKYFDMWVDSAKGPAVPAVLDLYNYLLKKNFKIIFITGRKEYQYEPTIKNLIGAGYEHFDSLIVKGEEYSGQTAEKFKSEKRTELTKKGYIIAGTVGDQLSDLSGPYHGIQVKIPNYMYIIY